jgi:hypothetical protein
MWAIYDDETTSPGCYLQSLQRSAEKAVESSRSTFASPTNFAILRHSQDFHPAILAAAATGHNGQLVVPHRLSATNLPKISVRDEYI